MPEISRLNQQISVVMFENSGTILSFWGLWFESKLQATGSSGWTLLRAMLKWNQHCLGILAILIVKLLCSLSNTFAPKCRDSSTAVKGGFFTSFMHSHCRKSVGSVYLTLLGVWNAPRALTDFCPLTL